MAAAKASWDAVLKEAEKAASELGETKASFIVLDSTGEVLAASFMGNDQNRTGAICKGNVVIADGNADALWNPSEKFGKCGLCYVCCGCLCCDFNMLCGAMCCTKKLKLKGAVPVKLQDGKTGAFCVAAAGGDCDKDHKIAVLALERGGGYKEDKGIFVADVAVDMQR